jgi:hypothetical protein
VFECHVGVTTVGLEERQAERWKSVDPLGLELGSIVSLACRVDRADREPLRLLE